MAYGLSTSLSGRDCYLDRLAELKGDGIAWLELCLREEDGGADCLRAADRIQAAGLRVFSLHLPFGGTVNPAEMQETARRGHVERLCRLIRETIGLGTGIYVIHASAEPIEPAQREQAMRAAARSLEELTAFMAPLGQTLALENLPRSCIGRTPEEIGVLLDQVPGLRLCQDTNHFTPLHPDERLRALQRRFPSLRRRLNPEPVPDVVQYARHFAGKIATVHLSDYDGVNECHWHPGQGIVPFRAIGQVLADAGFSAPLIFEPNERCRGRRTTGRRLIAGYERALRNGAHP